MLHYVRNYQWVQGQIDLLISGFIKSNPLSFIQNFPEPKTNQFEKGREPSKRENVEQRMRKAIQGKFWNDVVKL